MHFHMSWCVVTILWFAARGEFSTSEWGTPPPQQPQEETGQAPEIPEGFVHQALELGGRILRPSHWKFESRQIGKTLAYKIWEPLPDGEPGFDTSLTIDIVTNVSEAGQTPSDYATAYLKGFQEKGRVLRVDDPRTVNDRIQSGLLMDQKLVFRGAEREYRIQRFLVADDNRGLLFVVSFGTLVTEWESLEPTFRIITKHMQLIDLSAD